MQILRRSVALDSWRVLKNLAFAVLIGIAFPLGAYADDVVSVCPRTDCDFTEIFSHGDVVQVVHWNVAILPEVLDFFGAGYRMSLDDRRARGDYLASHYTAGSIVTINEAFNKTKSPAFFKHLKAKFAVAENAKYQPPGGVWHILFPLPRVNGGLAIGWNPDHVASGTGASTIYSKYNPPPGSYHCGADGNANKGILWRRIKFKGNSDFQLNVYTTHLDAGECDGDHEARVSQLAVLRTFIELTAFIYPVIVTGDFNIDGLRCHYTGPDPDLPCNPTSYSYLVNALTSPILGRPRDTYVLTCGGTPGSCSNSVIDDTSRKGKTDKHKQRLDFILYYPYWPVSGRIWDVAYLVDSYHIDSAKSPDSHMLSDHKIVSASFKFIRRRTAEDEPRMSYWPAVNMVLE